MKIKEITRPSLKTMVMEMVAENDYEWYKFRPGDAEEMAAMEWLSVYLVGPTTEQGTGRVYPMPKLFSEEEQRGALRWLTRTINRSSALWKAGNAYAVGTINELWGPWGSWSGDIPNKDDRTPTSSSTSSPCR